MVGLYTQQDYFDQQYGIPLHSHCTCTYTEQHCSFKVSLRVPCSTYITTLLCVCTSKYQWSYFKETAQHVGTMAVTL